MSAPVPNESGEARACEPSWQKAGKGIVAFLLLAVVIAGVIVRCVDLPLYTPDSGDELGNTIAPFRILYEGGNPETFFHPSLYYDVTALAYALVFRLLKMLGVIGSSMSMTDVFFTHENVFVFAARGVSVLAAMLSMWVLYAIGMWLWAPSASAVRSGAGAKGNRLAGLAAAALLAVFPLHVLYSLTIRVDSLFVLTFVYAAWRIVRILEEPDRRTYALAGFFTGLAIGANYSGVVLVPWLVAAHLCGSKPRARNLEGALVLAGATFLVTSPYVIANSSVFIENITFISGMSTSVHPGWADRGALYYAEKLVQANPLLAALIAAASLAIVFLGSRTERFILSLPLGYLVLFSLASSKDERFILPALVLLLLVAAGLPVLLSRGFRSRPIRIGIAAVSHLLVFAAIGWSAAESFRVPLPQSHPVLSRPDGLVLNWIEANAPPHSDIVVESGLVHLIEVLKLSGRFAAEVRASVARVRPNLDHNYIGAVFIGGCNYDPEAVAKGEIDYAVISRRNMNLIEKACGTYEKVCSFYAELRARGRVVFEAPNGFEPALIYKLDPNRPG